MLKFRRNALFFLTGSFFVGFGLGTYWVLFNLYMKERGFGEEVIGRVLMSGATGTFVMALPAAMIVSRFPTRLVMILAAVTAACGYGLMICPVPLPFIMLGAALASAAFSAHNIAAAPFFMRNSDPGERLDLFGTHSAIEVAAGVIGAAGGGYLVRFLEPHVGGIEVAYRMTLALASCLVLVAVIPYLGIREEKHAAIVTDLVALLKRAQHGLMARLVLPKFITGLGAALIIPFLNLYFRDRFHLHPDRIGTIFAVSQALTVAAYVAGPHLARRVGRIRAIAGTELLSIPFFVVMALTDRLEFAVAAFWMRGALMNMNQPISGAFAMEMVRPEEQPLTNALVEFAWHGAWMISTQVGGWLIEHHGYRLPMFITVALYVIASSLYLSFFHDAERKLALRTATA
ncbi:MAG TPA: MFS transporter [Candidatus Eisenbacteria bacterium]